MQVNHISHVPIVGVLWLYSSGLYLTKMTPLSPVYLGFFIILISFFILFTYKESISVSKGVVLPSFLGLYYISLFISSPPAMVMNIILTFTCPVLLYAFFSHYKIKYSIILGCVWFYSFLLLGDGIWRLLHPAEFDLDKLEELGIGFHIYKLNSFMYMDSNTVGIQGVSLLSFACFIGCYIKRISIPLLMIILIAIIITFSRAAILSSLLLIIFYYLFIKKVPILFLYLIVCLIFIFTTIGMLFYFSEDHSFLSKFHILELAATFLGENDWGTILLGVGLGNAIDFLGMGAHNLFVTFLVETGVLGTLVFCFTLFCWWCALRKDWILIVFPTLLASMSLGTVVMPYLFTFVTLSILIKKKYLVVDNI